MEDFVIGEIGSRFNQITGGTAEIDVNKRIFAITGGEYDLLSLFRRVFGFRGIPYGVAKVGGTDKMSTADGNWPEIKTYSEKEPIGGYSALGTPIFQPLKMLDLGNLKTGQKLEPYLFPNEPLVTVNNTKRLVETPSAGGTQDVIEHISLNFYTIKIQGFIVNMDDDDYPEEQVRQLRSYYELPRSVKVESPLLSLFNINLFAFKTIALPAVEGHQSIQGYEITGRSDKPYQLVKKKNA